MVTTPNMSYKILLVTFCNSLLNLMNILDDKDRWSRIHLHAKKLFTWKEVHKCPNFTFLTSLPDMLNVYEDTIHENSESILPSSLEIFFFNQDLYTYSISPSFCFCMSIASNKVPFIIMACHVKNWQLFLQKQHDIISHSGTLHITSTWPICNCFLKNLLNLSTWDVRYSLTQKMGTR